MAPRKLAVLVPAGGSTDRRSTAAEPAPCSCATLTTLSLRAAARISLRFCKVSVASCSCMTLWVVCLQGSWHDIGLQSGANGTSVRSRSRGEQPCVDMLHGLGMDMCSAIATPSVQASSTDDNELGEALSQRDHAAYRSVVGIIFHMSMGRLDLQCSAKEQASAPNAPWL